MVGITKVKTRYDMEKIYFLQEKTEGIKIVVGYGRKSRGISGKDFKVDNKDVLKKQRERIEAICNAYNWHLIYFEEIGSGGSVVDRKEMQKLQKYVEENIKNVDMILAFDLDRLGREDDMVPFYNLLRENEILIGDSTEDKIYDLNNDTDKTYFDMKRLFAGMEYRKNKIRNKEHRLEAFKRGQWLGGQAPFPYEFNQMSKGLEVKEENKKLYYQIVNKFLSGWSYTALATILDENNIPTPQEKTKKWDYNAIQTLLLSEVHRGMLVVKGYKNPKKEYIKLPQEEWSINYHPKWEQLIDKNTNDKILAEYFRRKRLSKKSANQIHTLSGLLYCGVCDTRLTVFKNPSGFLATRKCKGKDGNGCTNRGGVAETIEQDILSLLELVIDDLSKVEVAQNSFEEKIEILRKQIDIKTKEIENKNKTFENLQTMASEMWSIYSDEQKEDHKEKVKEINEEIVILKDDINAYQENIIEIENKKGKSDVERYEQILKKLKNIENSEAKNRKYKEFIHKIHWYKTENTMNYTFDLNLINF